MSEEIKIITLGDIFKNIETEEKAFKFKDYITNLQQKVEQLENIRKEAIEYTKENKNKTIAPYGDDEDTDYETCLFEDDIENLLNILNKGSEE